MAIIGPSGRDIPARSDAADATAAFSAYDASGVPVIPASSSTHAASRVAEFRASGGDAPVLVWREDARQLHYHPNTGAAGDSLRFLAGEQGGIEVHLAAALEPRIVTAIKSAQFGAAAAGITWDGEWLTFAQGGMLLGKLTAVWRDGNVGLGRTVTTLTTSSGVELARAEGGDEDRVGDTVLTEIAAGTRMRIESYHQATTSRWVNVMLTAIFITGASWTRFL